MQAVERETPNWRVPRPLVLPVQLTDDDLVMVEAFVEWKRRHPTRTPQRWEIVHAYGARVGRLALNGTRVFDRLKLLGVINHKRNGASYLAADFKVQIGLAS